MSQIIEYLQNVKKVSSKTIEAIVLEHGQTYETPASPRPAGMRKGRQGYCYANSYRLAIARNMTYVEGFAVPFKEIGIAIQHAWCVDQEGTVIETTWDFPACEYYGIPLEMPFIHQVIYETRVWGVLDARSETFRKRFYADPA